MNKELNWVAHRLLVSDRKRRVMVDLQRFKSITLTVNNNNNNNNNNNQDRIPTLVSWGVWGAQPSKRAPGHQLIKLEKLQ